MHINLNTRTIGFCPHILSNFRTYSRPDLILLSVEWSVRPLPAASGSPASCHIRWSANRQNIFANRWHVKKPTMENSIFFLVFGLGYIYEGIWPSDYIRHLPWKKNMPHFTGEMGILVPKNNI